HQLPDRNTQELTLGDLLVHTSNPCRHRSVIHQLNRRTPTESGSPAENSREPPYSRHIAYALRQYCEALCPERYDQDRLARELALAENALAPDGIAPARRRQCPYSQAQLPRRSDHPDPASASSPVHNTPAPSRFGPASYIHFLCC